MDVILLQQFYPNREYLQLMELTFTRHARYCERHGIDYQVTMAEYKPLNYGAWDKVILLKQSLALGYKLAVWLDADTLIYDTDTDLRDAPNPADTIGVVMFEKCRFFNSHYNVGALYCRQGPRVMEFLDKWLALYPGKAEWREQQVFNAIANETVYRLPDAWNHTLYRHPENGKPVVRGYHSVRGATEKAEAMRADL